MSVSMLEPAKSDVGTELSPWGRAAGSFWKHSEAPSRDSESPQEQRTHMNPALRVPGQAGRCPWSENYFTWLGGSLWIQGQGPVELEHFPLQQQSLLWWARSCASSPAQDMVPGEQSHSGHPPQPTWAGENTHLANRN